MPPSRRDVLSTLGATGSLALAGCSSSAFTSASTCQTEVLDPDEPHPLIRSVTATVDDEWVVLEIELDTDAENASALEQLVITGSHQHVIPILGEGPQESYEQSLGPLPYHGHVVVRAMWKGGPLDRMAVAFSCAR